MVMKSGRRDGRGMLNPSGRKNAYRIFFEGGIKKVAAWKTKAYVRG
jgi:hypothetical protein